MPTSACDTILDELQKKCSQNSPVDLEEEEISCILSCFVPSADGASSQQAEAMQSKAYVALSAICSQSRRLNQTAAEISDAGTVRKFTPTIENRLREVEETPILEAVSFLTALFTVDWASAAVIFNTDGVQDAIMDAFDLFPSSDRLPSAVASLLAQACGYNQCRKALLPRCTSWLEKILKFSSDPGLLASTALAQLKRSLGKDQNPIQSAASNTEEPDRSIDYVALLRVTRATLMDLTDDSLAMAETVEGFAYLTSIPSMKEAIVADTALLSKLISLRPRVLPRDTRAFPDEQTTTSLSYGLAVIFSNICAYRPKLTEEETGVKKLQQTLQEKSPMKSSTETAAEAKLDDDEHVKSRGRKLILAGVVELLVSVTRASNRPAVREMVGKAFLNLVTDQANRGKVLQDGGSKALMTIIRSSLESTANKVDSTTATSLNNSSLLGIQALAKLCITTSSLQVFGPNEGLIHDAIRPLSILLTHDSSSLLQQFEAMMALTNLASVGPDAAKRIAKSDGLMNKVEFLLLDDNEMVRRAATELVCNLVSGCEDVYNRFSGEGSQGGAKSRLQILVTLSDVDDVQTRLAASGAVAILTESASACSSILALQRETQGVLHIFKDLISPSEDDDDDITSRNAEMDAGLQHRGIICLKNSLLNQKDASSRKEFAEEIQQAGLVNVLVDVAKAVSNDQGRAMLLRPIAEILRCLAESGVKVF